MPKKCLIMPTHPLTSTLIFIALLAKFPTLNVAIVEASTKNLYRDRIFAPFKQVAAITAVLPDETLAGEPDVLIVNTHLGGEGHNFAGTTYLIAPEPLTKGQEQQVTGRINRLDNVAPELFCYLLESRGNPADTILIRRSEIRHTMHDIKNLDVETVSEEEARTVSEGDAEGI